MVDHDNSIFVDKIVFDCSCLAIAVWTHRLMLQLEQLLGELVDGNH